MIVCSNLITINLNNHITNRRIFILVDMLPWKQAALHALILFLEPLKNKTLWGFFSCDKSYELHYIKTQFFDIMKTSINNKSYKIILL